VRVIGAAPSADFFQPVVGLQVVVLQTYKGLYEGLEREKYAGALGHKNIENNHDHSEHLLENVGEFIQCYRYL
jgi:hypothetical protein